MGSPPTVVASLPADNAAHDEGGEERDEGGGGAFRRKVCMLRTNPAAPRRRTGVTFR